MRVLIDITSLILSGPKTSHLIFSQMSNELKEEKFKLEMRKELFPVRMGPCSEELRLPLNPCKCPRAGWNSLV